MGCVDTLPGRFSEPLQQVAQALGIYVVFPSYERPERRRRLQRGRADRATGDVLGIYRKTHLFPTERLTRPRAVPDARLRLVNTRPRSGRDHTPLASIGLAICYDGDFPSCSARGDHGRRGDLPPELLTRSFEIWELTNRARAYDNHVYMVACNGVGPDAGGNYYFGHSMIVDPIAHKLAQGRGTEEVVFAELNPTRSSS